VTARTWAIIRHDLRLQFRYGIYAAYAVVVGFYLAQLFFLNDVLPRWVPALIIFTDPAAVAFFFLGALMMLEKSEGVRAALAVTPMTAAEYLLGKAITLVGLSVLSCAMLIPFMDGVPSPWLLVLTVLLTAIQYLGIGVPIALRFRTVSGYLLGSAALLTPVIAPGMLALMEPFPGWLAVLPAASQFRLMLVATGAATATQAEVGIMLLVSAVAAAGGIWLALRDLRREFGQ
jgi:fluoroquinolone transport system permease protein